MSRASSPCLEGYGGSRRQNKTDKPRVGKRAATFTEHEERAVADELHDAAIGLHDVVGDALVLAVHRDEKLARAARLHGERGAHDFFLREFGV
jgi:hypothetical protein